MLEGDRLRRPVPLPLTMRRWIQIARRFAPREKREAMRRFAGYFVLERI